MTNTSEQPYRDVAKATRDEIDMLIERLENMQKNYVPAKEGTMKPNDWKFEVWPEPPKTGMRVGMPRGVKVTHIPTGMIEACDSERSMHANRDKAINALAARLMQPANT